MLMPSSGAQPQNPWYALTPSSLGPAIDALSQSKARLLNARDPQILASSGLPFNDVISQTMAPNSLLSNSRRDAEIVRGPKRSSQIVDRLLQTTAMPSAATVSSATQLDTQLVSLGSSCSTKLAFEELGRGQETLPFDWMCTSIEGIINFLINDFQGFFDFNNVESSQIGPTQFTVYRSNTHSWWHDDPRDPAVREKFTRRVRRLREMQAVNRPILFVRHAATTDEIPMVGMLMQALLQRFGRESRLLFLVSAQDAAAQGPYLVDGMPNLLLFLTPIANGKATFCAPVSAALNWISNSGQLPNCRRLQSLSAIPGLKPAHQGMFGMGGLEAFDNIPPHVPRPPRNDGKTNTASSRFPQFSPRGTSSPPTNAIFGGTARFPGGMGSNAFPVPNVAPFRNASGGSTSASATQFHNAIGSTAVPMQNLSPMQTLGGSKISNANQIQRFCSTSNLSASVSNLQKVERQSSPSTGTRSMSSAQLLHQPFLGIAPRRDSSSRAAVTSSIAGAASVPAPLDPCAKVATSIAGAASPPVPFALPLQRQMPLASVKFPAALKRTPSPLRSSSQLNLAATDLMHNTDYGTLLEFPKLVPERTRDPQPREAKYKVHDKIEAWSRSGNSWRPGVVESIDGPMIWVHFQTADGGWMKKGIPEEHEHLRRAATLEEL